MVAGVQEIVILLTFNIGFISYVPVHCLYCVLAEIDNYLFLFSLGNDLPYIQSVCRQKNR